MGSKNVRSKIISISNFQLKEQKQFSLSTLLWPVWICVSSEYKDNFIYFVEKCTSATFCFYWLCNLVKCSMPVLSPEEN